MAGLYKDQDGNIWQMDASGKPVFVSAGGSAPARSGGLYTLPKEPDPDKQINHQLKVLELQQKMKDAQAGAASISPSNLSGQDYLKTLDRPTAALVQALADGRKSFPTGMALKTPYWQNMLQHVANFDPGFDEINYTSRAATRKDFTSGKAANNIRALNTAIGHLGHLATQISGTASHDFTPLNAVENAGLRMTGDPGPTNFDTTAGALAGELTAVYRGSGGAEADIQRYISQLNPNASAAQKKAAIGNIMTLLKSRLDALNDQYTKGMGTTAQPLQLLDPGAQKLLSTYAPSLDGNTPPAAPKTLGAEEKAKFFDILQNQGADAADAYLRQFGQAMKDKSAANRPYSQELEQPKTYGDSYLSQALSGANEGLGSVLGAPVDLTTAAINLVPKGINAVANTDIPSITNPIGGGEWWKNRLSDVGSILNPSSDASKQFVRRVGQSVGAAAVPAAASGSLLRAGAGLLSGLGGGIGGATAQQVAPGNPIADIAGDTIGSGLTGLGLLKAAQRASQRGIEAAVPTIDQLKGQASDLYNAAESRGIVASPEQTQQLSANFRQALQDEGRISPTGRISEVYPKAREAVQLIDDYAGHTMNPTQIQNVRKVVGDALSSPEPSERRLGSILTDQLDQWANPLAPELAQARDVSSRYLTAEQLARARELAGARASQFTGSGFENALRTEYRGLDRGAIKGNNFFNGDVNDAIENVARGTPTSNFFRGLGRLAPTGPVSGMGSVVPALAAGSMAGPATGGAVGASLAGAGILGRTVATRMGINAANQAELVARNGGALDRALLMPDSIRNYVGLLAAVQAAKNLNQQP
jgi:hypothetical protein